MKIPYVIDNQTHRMADILPKVLDNHSGRSVDIATAYFTVGGYGLLKEGLHSLGSFRMLLGAEPSTGKDIGLEPDSGAIKGLIRSDLEDMSFSEDTLRLVEDLIGYLSQDKVAVKVHDQGFLHAKCWLFYSDRPGQQMLFDRFRPILAIVGSSNFTYPGLTSNRELNLTHKVLLEAEDVEDPDAAYAVKWLSDEKPSDKINPVNRQLIKSEVGARAIIDLEKWYERQWADARDFKDELIELLDASKFGRTEYTPYQVYMKALFEYFADDLDAEPSDSTRSAVDLAEFQEDAVKKARKILMRYDGVMVADSVGLGKTWIGKKLLEDFAYHLRQKALVICPASLRDMWKHELREASIAAQIVSQEELGQQDYEVRPVADADVILIDESHNFRNRNAQRFGNLERLLGCNGGRGRDGGRKKVILLTATPINNDLLDLYNQISLITQGDRSYFTSCGIGDLYRYFLKARRDGREGRGVIALFNLLEEVVIRRTRPFIRHAYPDATIRGKRIHFPERRLRTIHYDLEQTYAGIYEEIVSGIESLKLAPYNLESYKKAGEEVDELEAGREQALVGIFKSRYLKRFESSIEAFRISLRRAMAFLETFESYLLDKKLLASSDFHKALRYLAREDEDDEATPRSMADAIDESEDARACLEQMETIDTEKYRLRAIHSAVRHDIDTLNGIWMKVKDIGPDQDAKLVRLKEMLSTDLKGQKVLVFSYFKDTARYLYKHLGDPKNPSAAEFVESLGSVNIKRMDGGTPPKERTKHVQRFSPKSNERPDLVGSDKEIDVLIATDVLSEGQNLQDCGNLLNYDLHWNPTRMVQRAGRIDRIGTEYDTLWINNMFPDEGLERLLRLVSSLNDKIAAIDSAGFLDASVLGEAVHPRNFNTLRRIQEEDGSVIEEEEQFAELASNEFLQQQLKNLLDSGGKEMLDELPDGIHSGLLKAGAKGVFFYFKAADKGQGEQHFWKYYDLKEERIMDNRYLIANMIHCDQDTPRVVDPDMFAQVFDIQEKVIQDIIETTEHRRALQATPRVTDPIQQTIATTLQGYLNHPDINRAEAVKLIRFLNEPMLMVQIKELRKAYKDFTATSDINALVQLLSKMLEDFGAEAESTVEAKDVATLDRSDLRLICFDFVTS